MSNDELRVDVVDLVFVLRGSSIEVNYAEHLRSELRRFLPWFADEEQAGVHPLRGLSAVDAGYYLSGRSRLSLRLPRSRIEQGGALCGKSLDLGGMVAVGEASTRELAPATVLYSQFVSLGVADEVTFMAEANREVEDLGFQHARLICGKSQQQIGGDSNLRGFSLMLHGLGAAQSLRLQAAGLGGERQRGCGIFVPHKSVAAVGGEA